MTVEQTTQSPHEAAARTTKALSLVRVLADHGATTDQVRALPPTGRRMAETLAGTRIGSDATWAVVVAIFAERDRSSADPFAGLS